MSRSELARLRRLNKMQYHAACIAAEWSVRSDRRLLGIPWVRPAIARAAAHKAIGASAPLEEAVYINLHDESANVVLESYQNAVVRAREAVACLAPLRLFATK